MTLTPRWILPAFLALTASVASAVDYSEEEPNDAFPPSFLTGNPLLTPGTDRFVGNFDAAGGDFDLQYLRVAAGGAPGIYRYTFSVASDNAGADTAIDLFDASDSGFFLARSDDNGTTLATPPAVFDHLDLTGAADTTFGVEIFGFGNTAADNFNYAVSIAREEIIPDNLGALNGAFATTVDDLGVGGNWFTFTAGAGTLSLATTGDLDTEFVIYDSAGNAVIASDDTSVTDFNASIADFALTGGTYYLSTGQFNLLYDYNLTTGEEIGWDRAGVGRGFDPAGRASFGLSGSFTPVPEPASMAALGLGALALIRRRRSASRG